MIEEIGSPKKLTNDGLYQDDLKSQWNSYKSSVNDEALKAEAHAVTQAMRLSQPLSQYGVFAREILYELGSISTDDPIPRVVLATCKLKNGLSVLVMPDELAHGLEGEKIFFEAAIRVEPTSGYKAVQKIKKADLIGTLRVAARSLSYSLICPAFGKVLEIREAGVIELRRRQWLAILTSTS